MGKGSERRPTAVEDKLFEERWTRAFPARLTKPGTGSPFTPITRPEAERTQEKK